MVATRTRSKLSVPARIGAGVLLASCTSVLGLDEYDDAIAELCKCDQQVGFVVDCEATLSARLDGVSEPTREDWLQYFAEHCAGTCQQALACYDQPGTCSTLACAENAECCGDMTCNQDVGTCQ